MRIFKIAWIVFSLLYFIQPSWAARAYVTDSLKITLRRGPSTEHLVIAMLSSGEPVEVLESGEEWTRVRALNREREQEEGWVLSRYLMTREPWEAKAEVLSEENVSLKQKLAQLEGQLGESSNLGDKLSEELREKEEALKQVQLDYDTLKREAADFLKLKKEYESTRSNLETTQADVQSLTEEIGKLRASRRIRWFISGALVLFAGWLIGFIAGRLQKRLRRTSSYQY